MSHGHDPRLRTDPSDPAPLRLADPPPGAGHVIEPLLSIDDLIRILGCCRRVIERMRSAGRLPRPDLYVGRMPRWRYTKTILPWIERGGRP
jgi:hypothetical protein